MELKAWGDESMLVSPSSNLTYLLGVCLCELDEAKVRNTLGLIKPPQSSKLHWYEMSDFQRSRTTKILSSLPLQSIIISTTVSTRAKEERARHKCFESLLPLLEHKYDVHSLTMESRESHQNARDIRLIDGLRSRKFINDLHVDFIPGSQDARLWLPDQLLGIYNSTQGKSPKNEFPFEIDINDLGFCD